MHTYYSPKHLLHDTRQVYNQGALFIIEETPERAEIIYLNNAAIAAHSLRERVAILDIDFHHGNCTQEIFYSDPGVLYCSLHADPDQEYPYFWGAADEQGEGAGLGYNYNYPLPLGCDEALYLQTLEQALQRIR